MCVLFVAEIVLTWQLHQVPHSLPRYDDEWGNSLCIYFFHFTHLNIYIYIFFVNCEYYSDLNFTNHHPCKNFVFLPMNTICMFGDKGRLEKRHRCKTWWSIIDVLGLFCGSGVLSCILLNNRMSWWPLSRQKVTTQKCTCIQNNRYDCRRKKKTILCNHHLGLQLFFSPVLWIDEGNRTKNFTYEEFDISWNVLYGGGSKLILND